MLHRIGDPRAAAAVPIGEPVLGDEQRPVERDVPGGAGITEEDPYLAVANLAQGARVLAGDPSRMLPLFGKASFVHHQDAGRIAQLGDDIAAQVIAYGVGVPDIAVQDALDPPWMRVAGLLG